MSRWYICGLVLLGALFVNCSSAETHASLESAIKAAQSSSKNILIIISKSDECHACSLLERNVLTNPAWNPQKKYEVVMLDMTEEVKTSSPKKWSTGMQLQTRYGTRWYPAIILTDVRGLPYHIGGYDESSPVDFMQLLETRSQQRGPEMRALLAKATNGAKARAALARLHDWGVDTAYHQLKALAMSGNKDPRYAIELVDYWTALGDNTRRDEWLRVLEIGWPQAWRDTMVRQAVEAIEKNEFERYEWKQARQKLETLIARKPQGAVASKLYAALGETAYQLRERDVCLRYIEMAWQLAPEGKLKDGLRDRLQYLATQKF
jgi:thioredoxin-related protein